MNEPQLLTQAEARPAGRGLWSEAPGWRNLAVGAAVLTAAAIALPLALPNAPKAPTGPTPVVAANPPAAPPNVVHPAPTVIQTGADKAAQAARPPKVVIIEKYVTAPTPAPAPAPTPAPAVPAPAQAPASQLAAQTQALPSADTQACAIHAPTVAANVGAGTVVAFENRAMSLARIPLTQQQFGGQIDPDYIDNLRIGVRLDNGRTESFVVPRQMAVRVGDRVTLQGPHRNVALACNYLPPLVTADLGPAPKPAGGAALPPSPGP